MNRCGVQKLRKYSGKISKIAKIQSVILLLILFAGCATVPVYNDIDYFTFLSADNDVYASLQVQKNRATLSSLLKTMAPEMKESEIDQILDRTKTLYVGIRFGDSANKQDIEICAEGNFPSIITSAFTKGKGWSKNQTLIPAANNSTKKQAVYTHTNGISIALINPALIVLASNTVETILTSYFNPNPSMWPEYAIKAVSNIQDDEKIRAYIPNPENLLPKLLGIGVKLALEDATAISTELYVPGKTSQFITDIDLYFKDVRAVKAASAILKIASMKSDMSIVQKGDTHLSIEGIVLSIDAFLGMKF